jgi:hypothetical protein
VFVAQKIKLAHRPLAASISSMAKLSTIIVVLLLATAPLALADPLLPIPTSPEPPQAGPPPATSGGYVTCSIAYYCLQRDGKWTPQSAAANPMPVLKPTNPEAR